MSSAGYAATRSLGLSPATVGRVGVGIGLAAFIVALPPFHADTLWIPLLIGLLAIAVGIWVLSRGERRPGWTAIGFGLVGILLGILAAHASTTTQRWAIDQSSMRR